jgi:hypothetical protein
MGWSSFVPAGPDSSAVPLPITAACMVRLHAGPRSMITYGLSVSVPVTAPRQPLRLGVRVLPRSRGCGNNRSRSVICQRCGITDDSTATARYFFRTKLKLCSSCRAVPRFQVKTAAGWCRPWKGETDDNWNPIDNNGNLVMPGIRSCGYKDCMHEDHVIPEPDTIGTFRCRHKHVTATILRSQTIVEIPPCSICGEPTSMVSREISEQRSTR